MKRVLEPAQGARPIRKYYMRWIFFLFMSFGWSNAAWGKTINMGEIPIVGHVQKPQAVFINERTIGAPDKPGVQGLAPQLIRQILLDSRKSNPRNAR